MRCDVPTFHMGSWESDCRKNPHVFLNDILNCRAFRYFLTMQLVRR